LFVEIIPSHLSHVVSYIPQLSRARCRSTSDAVCLIDGINRAAGAEEVEISICWGALVEFLRKRKKGLGIQTII
jgi:hypothetical protein